MLQYLIIFGAGASSGSDDTSVPPLGGELFKELAKFNPSGWGLLPESFKSLLNEDFEQGILKLANDRPHGLPILQRVMAKYFFNFQPRNTSLYYKLGLLLKKTPKSFAISTLNYERLLELSFAASGHMLNIGIPNSSQVELNLPHGICHLFCESVRGMASGVSFAGLNIQVNGPLKLVSDVSEFNTRIRDDAFPPVMSYFEPQKRSTCGQEFLIGQRNRFNELVQNSQKVIIIGVKIREHDTHLWKPLAQTNAKLVYCSGKSSGEAFKKWGQKYRSKQKDSILYSHFKEGFAQILKELEINA